MCTAACRHTAGAAPCGARPARTVVADCPLPRAHTLPHDRFHRCVPTTGAAMAWALSTQTRELWVGTAGQRRGRRWRVAAAQRPCCAAASLLCRCRRCPCSRQRALAHSAHSAHKRAGVARACTCPPSAASHPHPPCRCVWKDCVDCRGDWEHVTPVEKADACLKVTGWGRGQVCRRCRRWQLAPHFLLGVAVATARPRLHAQRAQHAKHPAAGVPSQHTPQTTGH